MQSTQLGLGVSRGGGRTAITRAREVRMRWITIHLDNLYSALKTNSEAMGSKYQILSQTELSWSRWGHMREKAMVRDMSLLRAEITMWCVRHDIVELISAKFCHGVELYNRKVGLVTIVITDARLVSSFSPLGFSKLTFSAFLFVWWT